MNVEVALPAGNSRRILFEWLTIRRLRQASLYPLRRCAVITGVKRAGSKNGLNAEIAKKPVDIHFTIPLPPRTKKNHQQIRKNFKTGGHYVGQSDTYLQYEQDCMWFVPAAAKIKIDTPVNIKALFYMEKEAKVDVTNLNSALHDILVLAGVLLDDSSLNPQIVAGTDGSRVYVDKDRPRTEVYISTFKEDI